MSTKLFTRNFSEPILSTKDWPYPCNAVFNPGAVKQKDVCLSAKRTKPDRLSHSTCGERSMKESVHVVAPIKSVSIFAQISLDVFV